MERPEFQNDRANTRRRRAPADALAALMREYADAFPDPAADPKEVERRVADILRRAAQKRSGKLDPPR